MLSCESLHMLGMLLEHCLQRYPPKGCTKKNLQKVNLLQIKLELRGLNYHTPFYADCILKCLENRYKIYFFTNNFYNFNVTSKSNISKQIYKGEK
jgi:hypothetical protein